MNFAVFAAWRENSQRTFFTFGTIFRGLGQRKPSPGRPVYPGSGKPQQRRAGLADIRHRPPDIKNVIAAAEHHRCSSPQINIINTAAEHNSAAAPAKRAPSNGSASANRRSTPSPVPTQFVRGARTGRDLPAAFRPQIEKRRIPPLHRHGGNIRSLPPHPCASMSPIPALTALLASMVNGACARSRLCSVRAAAQRQTSRWRANRN